MTPCSAAAAGSRSSRDSSRSAALRTSSGSAIESQPLAELLDLGPLGVALAELVLDRLQLLAQEELALSLLHLRLDLRLDPRSELEDLELAVQDARDQSQALLDAHLLEQLLLLFGLQSQGRRDEVAERARVVDVRRRELELLRQVRDERDDAREQRLDVAGQRLDLARLLEHVRHLDEAPDQVRLDLHRLLEPIRRRPCTRMRSVPSGTRIILWITAAVPTS